MRINKSMAKRKKQKAELTLPVPELGTNVPELGTLIVSADDPRVNQETTNSIRVGHWCDSCHGMFEFVLYHPSAPGVPLCDACFKFVNRRATRSLQTPTNPERV